MSLSNASITRLSHSTPLLAARAAITQAKLLERTLAIQQIPAPTFQEEQRAIYVYQQFEALGLQGVEIDALYNVYGWLPHADENAPVLIISAHTDTVFPLETNLKTHQAKGKVYGIGIGDNSLGVAALLYLAELFLHFEVPRTARICFVANTREEGLGDLGGIKAALDHIGSIAAGIVLEGMALGRIYNAGIAVRRYKISVTGPGGHSWLHFGNPSAIHSLMAFGAELSRLPVSLDPRTTLNIGLVEGGSSVNTIAAQANCHLDLRSTEMETLEKLDQQVRGLAEKHTQPEIRFHFERVGDRPVGAIPNQHPLVQLAQQACRAIGMDTEIEVGSTDANAFLARGIPTVCVGVSYGGNAHTIDEYIETAPLENGLWHLLLLATAASNAAPTW